MPVVTFNDQFTVDSWVSVGRQLLPKNMFEIFTRFQLNIKADVKMAAAMNYRQIVDIWNMEPCRIMADRKWFPPVNYLFDRARELYPQFVHDCPYTVSNLII